MTDKPTVLVIEDDPTQLEALQWLIEEEGFQFVGLDNGDKALQYFCSNEPPDLILLDLMLPGMTGLELHERLIESPAWSRVAVIFLSGVGEFAALPEDAHLLLKPYRFIDLMDLIHRLCGKILNDPGMNPFKCESG